MPRQSKDQKIKELESRVSELMKIVENDAKRISELVAAEEKTFLHSPTYIQLCEKVEFIKVCEKLNEREIARLKGKIPQAEESFRKLYEDNKKMLEHSDGDTEYFIGITQNWHEAWEYRKQRDEIHKLNGMVEQLKLTLEQKDKEIDRLHLILGEKIVQEREQEAEVQEETASDTEQTAAASMTVRRPHCR